jgi:hypothetical protein
VGVGVHPGTKLNPSPCVTPGLPAPTSGPQSKTFSIAIDIDIASTAVSHARRLKVT